MKFLFVDDCADDAVLAAITLRREGLEFEERFAASSAEAEVLLKEGGFTAVVTDYNLGGETALDVLALVRAHSLDLPFIILSGTVGEERAVEAIRGGAHEFVMKDRMGRLAVALRREIASAEARAARRTLEERLLQQGRMLECVEQAVIATDLEGRVTSWNAFAEKLYGWQAAEAIGQPIATLTPAAESRDLASSVLSRLHAGESWAGEMTMRRRDGSTFDAWLIDAPLYDDSRNVVGMVGVSYDLTEQKRAEKQLLHYKAQLDMAQTMAGMGSWSFDAATGERRWSDSMCHVFGLDPGATLEQALLRIHRDDRAEMAALQKSAYETRQAFRTEFRIDRDGDQRTLSTWVEFIDDGTTPARTIGVVQDITDVRRAGDELHRRARQQSLIANLSQMALSGASVSFLLRQAIGAVGGVMDFDLRGVLRKEPGGFVLVDGDGFPPAMLGGAVPLGEDSQCMYTVAQGVPVVLADVETETRFTPAPFFVDRGLVSGITVPINSADGTTWGLLVCFASRSLPYSPHDTDFLRAIAGVIGQAVDRSAADNELRVRARQQSAIAKLGSMMLTSVDRDVFQTACDLLEFGTGADYAFYVALVDHDRLQFSAGRLWSADLPLEVPVSANAQVGYTIICEEPVVVDDYATEERFDSRAATLPYGIRSGAMVPVASATRIFGALSAQSREAGHFRSTDVDFLQALANMLAEAMEREIAREDVEASEHRYRRIFEGASEVIFTVDTEGRFQTLNPAFTAITGLDRDLWLGRTFADVLIPEDRERLQSLFAKMLSDGQTVTTETSLLGADGIVVVEVTSFCKMDQGVVTEVYGFARDITEERRSERESERVTRSLELLLESTVEGIYTVDVNGRCTMLNRAAAELLGYLPGELIGVGMHELMHAGSAAGLHRSPDECAIAAVLRTGEPRTVTNEAFIRKDGSRIPVEYSAAPIVDAGVRVGAVVSFTDLTDRLKLEAKLEQATRLSSLGRLAATVAHEFNNVLMGISPFVEVARRAKDRDKIDSALEYINNSVKRGRRITQDILRFTQPAEPMLAALDLAAWLGALGTEARSVLPSHYAIDVDGEPLMTDADPNQLHQIFMNLILNARDAMSEGGAIRIRARREGPGARFPFGVVDDPSRYAHISVSDTGCGMSEETLRHAFEPLFTTKKSGTGLGLAVTHQVVQRHGGEIFIESILGEGTTFHVFLPLSAKHVDGTDDAPVDVLDARPSSRILLVEDDRTVAAGLMTLLELEGFAIEHAETGEAALQSLRRRRPDAIVLDVGLPDMDGKSVYAAVASLHPELPVIFSTGHADRGELEALLSRPNVSCLLKPYETVTLLDELARVMGD